MHTHTYTHTYTHTHAPTHAHAHAYTPTPTPTHMHTCTHIQCIAIKYNAYTPCSCLSYTSPLSISLLCYLPRLSASLAPSFFECHSHIFAPFLESVALLYSLFRQLRTHPTPHLPVLLSFTSSCTAFWWASQRIGNIASGMLGVHGGSIMWRTPFHCAPLSNWICGAPRPCLLLGSSFAVLGGTLFARAYSFL